VLAWGNNGFGQLGNGTETSSDTPVAAAMLPGDAKVQAISAGFAHNLALTRKGKVLAWGANDSGELGNGRAGGSSLAPIRVRLPKGVQVTAVAAGGQDSLARTTKGKVLAWGFNGDGELGNGRTKSSDIPVRTRLPHGTRVRGLVSGCGHALALTTRGKILAWGRNDHGQIGNGSTARRSKTPSG
jgi:alpha-tubulin suppressor-like RCC1 family protein